MWFMKSLSLHRDVTPWFVESRSEPRADHFGHMSCVLKLAVMSVGLTWNLWLLHPHTLAIFQSEFPIRGFERMQTSGTSTWRSLFIHEGFSIYCVMSHCYELWVHNMGKHKTKIQTFWKVLIKGNELLQPINKTWWQACHGLSCISAFQSALSRLMNHQPVPFVKHLICSDFIFLA